MAGDLWEVSCLRSLAWKHCLQIWVRLHDGKGPLDVGLLLVG